MNKIATFLSEKLAGKLDDLARRDMREWPPTSVPIYYQPQRPQRKVEIRTNKVFHSLLLDTVSTREILFHKEKIEQKGEVTHEEETDCYCNLSCLSSCYGGSRICKIRNIRYSKE